VFLAFFNARTMTSKYTTQHTLSHSQYWIFFRERFSYQPGSSSEFPGSENPEKFNKLFPAIPNKLVPDSVPRTPRQILGPVADSSKRYRLRVCRCRRKQCRSSQVAHPEPRTEAGHLCSAEHRGEDWRQRSMQ